MIPEVTNHLWQSTWFAVAAALLTVAFRKNRAHVRYWLWFSASLKFFVPFALLMTLGSHLGWAPATRKIAPPAVAFTIVQITEPFPQVAVPPAPPSRGPRDWAPSAFLAVWALGFATVALIRLRGWLRIRAAVRSSTPIDLAAAVPVRSSPGLLEPGVVGCRRPILLLPAGIAERLTPPQLQAVLAHEMCHVHRGDNLFAAVHMAVEGMFWFHPLIWWIGARLVEERERACDEAVLTLGSDPHVYAEAILNVCKLYVESPLVCVSGVTGSNLKRRIEGIMTNRAAIKLNLARKAVLAVAAVAALAAPILVGIVNAPHARAQSGAAPAPKFVLATIQPCAVGEAPSGGRGHKNHPANMQVHPFPISEGGVDGSSPSGSLTVNCQSVMSLIEAAYVFFADGHFHFPQSVPIELGPAWINSSHFDIRATGAGPESQEMMMGPMLQALLEDRLKLKIHRETREVPVYALMVAKGGLKLQPFQEGSCTPMKLTGLREAVARGRYSGQVFEPVLQPGVNYCLNRATGDGADNLVEAQATSIDEFSNFYFSHLDRPVINQTGITGLFNFRLEYAGDAATPGPSLFAALEQQLGLRLEPATGPRDFLVIDHVEMPSAN